MHSRDVPDFADATPRAIPSETPESAYLESNPTSGSTESNSKESSEGPPKTVWGTIAFACTIIGGAYCWGFTAWDKSEFPGETLENPLFWWGLALLLALATVYSFLVRTSNLLDQVLIGAMCMVATGSAIQGYRVSREIRPSETQFTIAVFGFIGDGDALTNDMARRIRGTIVDQLRTRVENVPRQMLILSRDRNPKGETPEEEADYVRKWAKRGRGAHLALWLRVHMKSGDQYTADVRYLWVSPWGTELHRADPGMIVSQEEVPFTAQPGGNMPADRARKIIDDAKFFWGVAAFQRDDCQTALSVLPPLNTGIAEFFSAKTLLEASRKSSSPGPMRRQAMDHIARATQIESIERRRAIYLGELSDELISYVDEGLSDAPREHIRYASNALCEQNSLLHKLGVKSLASVEIMEAEVLVQLAEVEEAEAEISSDLQKARALAETAARDLDPGDKRRRSTILNILGNIDRKEGDFETAVSDYRESIALEDDPVVRKNLAETEMLVALKPFGDVKLTNSRLAEAFQAYEQAEKTCGQADMGLCFIVHYGACDARLTIAERLEFDLALRKRWLEDADAECEAARQYESTENPSDVIKLSSQLIRMAEKYRRGSQRFYDEAIKDLTKVIDALSTNSSTARSDLLLRRARLYRLSGPAYQQVAQQDQAEAHRLSQQRVDLASPSNQYRPKWAASLTCTESPAY